MRPTGEHRPSPADQARAHMARVAETGTTDSIDVLGRPVVLLTTRGVRSGEPRTVPLMRVENDGSYAVVASRGGSPQNPGWYFNVKAEPHVALQDGAVTKDYTAREVTGEEKASWWARAVAAFPPYDRIQGGTAREIPVFLLEEHPRADVAGPHVRAAADRLLDAARTGTPCAPVRDLLPDGELATGYAVQSLLTRARLAHGRRAVGRKIGLTAPTVQAQLGVDRPDIGVLFDDMACPQHETVDIGRLLQPRIEAEIAVVLAADLDHDDLTEADVRAAVDHAVAALEIVDSRIARWDITLVDTVADNASSGLYVLGDDRVDLADRDLRTVDMTMTDRTGEIVSSGSGADCLGDPVAALLWLARTAREVGSPLRAGEVVLTGALGPMVPVTAGGTYRASLSGLGTVEASFSTPTSKVAVIGSGNIGTDLMMKVIRVSETLEMGAMVGIDPDSDGLARAARLGVPTTADGVDGLIARPDFDDIRVVFDATSAGAHLANAAKLAPHGKILVDLTPAAIGPFVVPAVNLDEHRSARNVNMVTCGGQATIPIVAAIAAVAPVRYGEIVASIASRSAGPGTRANINEFTETTSAAIERVGGAERGKAIIVLNPADPPMIMRDTVLCLVADADPGEIRDSIDRMVTEVSRYVPGYRLKQPVQIDAVPDDEPLDTLLPAGTPRPVWKVSVFLEVVGAAHYLPAYAGNLDIMTSAALRTAEHLAATVGTEPAEALR